MLQFAALTALAALLVSSVAYALHDMRMKRLMPPGPRGLPFVGNAFQMPSFIWLRFTEWSQQYGTCAIRWTGQP